MASTEVPAILKNSAGLAADKAAPSRESEQGDARHGASMQGPDYTWWHGMYEVAKYFYEKFIPQLEEVAGKEVAKELLDKYVYTQEGHLWHRDGMSKDALQKIQKFYEDRYQQ